MENEKIIEITADEMREMQETLYSKKFKEQLARVNKALREASQENVRSAFIYENLLTAIKAKLEEAGYEVNVESQYNEVTTVISWL